MAKTYTTITLIVAEGTKIDSDLIAKATSLGASQIMEGVSPKMRLLVNDSNLPCLVTDESIVADDKETASRDFTLNKKVDLNFLLQEL